MAYVLGTEVRNLPGKRTRKGHWIPCVQAHVCSRCFEAKGHLKLHLPAHEKHHTDYLYVQSVGAGFP